MQLMYAKGTRYFEDEPVYGTSIDDIDINAVADYCKRIGYGKSAEEYIRQNKSYIVKTGDREELSGAAILLFGKEPQQYFKRARVRFIRYEGTEAKVGAQMNVVKDEIFEGRILQIVEQSIEFVRSQIKEHTYLGKEGKYRITAGKITSIKNNLNHIANNDKWLRLIVSYLLLLPRHRHRRSNPETSHLISKFPIFISELLSIIRRSQRFVIRLVFVTFGFPGVFVTGIFWSIVGTNPEYRGGFAVVRDPVDRDDIIFDLSFHPASVFFFCFPVTA